MDNNLHLIINANGTYVSKIMHEISSFFLDYANRSIYCVECV
jgi:hypothetical protein